MSNTFKRMECNRFSGGAAVNDEEFNRRLERILEVIYQVGDKSRKEAELQQIKYGNAHSHRIKSTPYNIDTAEEKKLYR